LTKADKKVIVRFIAPRIGKTGNENLENKNPALGRVFK